MKQMHLFIVLSVCSYIALAQTTSFGFNIQNTRLSLDTKITPANAANLKTKWIYNANGDITATPAVLDLSIGRVVIFPDWAGYVHCLQFATGQKVWSIKLNAATRNTPAYDAETGLFFVGASGNLYAIRAIDGVVMWTVKHNPYPYAMTAQSPVVHNGFVYGM
jgi:outer membrane protein assembly factor BamB